MPRILFFCFLLLAANVYSESKKSTLEHLLEIEIAAFQLSSAFSAYVQFNGSPKFSEQLESTIKSNQQVFNPVRSGYPNIYKKWHQSLDFVNESRDLVFDGADRRLVTGHAIYQNQLYKLIEEAQKKTESIAPAANRRYQYLATKSAFERVIAQYISFTGSATGFIHSDVSIEESVAEFSNKVESISNKNADFQRLNKKWNFIKGNMTTEASQTTPFITLHTAADIRRTIERIYKNEIISSSDF